MYTVVLSANTWHVMMRCECWNFVAAYVLTAVTVLIKRFVYLSGSSICCFEIFLKRIYQCLLFHIASSFVCYHSQLVLST